MEFFLCVVGMVMVIEGLPYFGFPEKMKSYMQVVLEQDDTILRIIGAGLMVMGLVLLFLARRGLNTL
jgi:uncharacterized protein